MILFEFESVIGFWLDRYGLKDILGGGYSMSKVMVVRNSMVYEENYSRFIMLKSYMRGRELSKKVERIGRNFECCIKF